MSTDHRDNTPVAGDTFYVTTTLPYVNGTPHLGHAFEYVRADAIARFKRLEGFEVFFNTGADEHGQKILREAEEASEDPQTFVDRQVKPFQKLLEQLDISNNAFIRTTDPEHKRAAQAFWKVCADNGDIYKKEYKGLYCVGCELFVTEKDLDENGECPDHPGQEPIEVAEENYFFAFSNYADKLLKLYENQPDFVVPESRLNEIRTFVESGLEDFSISRVKEKMPWGVPVPGDENQVMYVWFDALSNYLSTLGWPEDTDTVAEFWPPVQFAGKDNLRQQAAMWQAMLMSAGFDPSEQVVIHGHIQSGGQKMSKSVGNVIDPAAVIEEYSADALRYYLLRHLHPFEDPDMTPAAFKELYNANLANGLGNLVSRIIKMYASYDVDVIIEHDTVEIEEDDFRGIKSALNEYRFDEALDYIWAEIAHLDAYIAEEEPFKQIKSDDEIEVEGAKQAVAYLVLRLHDISVMLLPFMPETAEKIQEVIDQKEVSEPLFERKE